MNVWCVTGNLGADAEIRFTAAGSPLCQFPLATTSGYGVKTVTTWARCTWFGKRAETAAQYLLKGRQIAVTGEVKLHEWTNKAGVAQQSLEVNVQDVTLVGFKPEAKPQAKPAAAQPTQQPAADFMDDDIPF